MLAIEPHPLLELGALAARFPSALGERAVPEEVAALLSLDAAAPLARDEETRRAVRDLLRRGGYRPTGRGKPSSEYLARAAGEGALRSIDAAVDCGNAVSLHSGIPVSVVDLDRTEGALSVGVAAAGERFVFNPAGQEIDVAGLLSLRDARGPCANAVKDAQRTKTTGDTTRVLAVLWGSVELGDRTARALDWLARLLERSGATIEGRIP